MVRYTFDLEVEWRHIFEEACTHKAVRMAPFSAQWAAARSRKPQTVLTVC